MATIVQKIRDILKWLLPLGVVEKRRAKHFNNFLIDCRFGVGNYDTIPRINSKFRNIIAVQGFGYSGHTAGLDLLREYKTICMPSDPQDNVETNTYKKSASIEVDFMRLAGGLIELEKYLCGENVFQNDAAIQRLIKLLGTNRFLKLNNECEELTKSFVDYLISLQIDGVTTPLYNYHLQNGLSCNPSIYFIKHLTIEEYRSLVNNYLSAIFNTFYKKGKEFIIADHLFSDLEIGQKIKEDYVANLKTIVIYRDPRDVYAEGVNNDVPWIPHTNVKDYIKWWRLMLSSYDPDSNESLYVKFEDLIMNYEQTVKRVESYIGLKSEDHIYKGQCLIPESSAKNVGIWKAIPELKKDFETIKNGLEEFCYSL